ncbi:GyrI-like domain-containing protein [Aestuariimicrobium soli]|uniref:GyrI-like domain-containing protein n=1 Tax=Aestuariimicrobium soli TaxID=2035834 RepID=UPI003EB9EB64
MPEQPVISVTSTVRVGQIDQHIERASGVLAALAEPVGPVFVLYHGEVSDVTANPVEVCQPVASLDGLPASDDVVARVEPEHVEAYVTITKAETDYPEIMGAYGAVDLWVNRRRVEVSASPREVYFADFATARLDELVCDVAFPIEGYQGSLDDH